MPMVAQWRSILDNPWHAKQIDRIDRGARQVLAENIPVEPAWVMPAKGVLDVQGCRPSMPATRAERNYEALSPTSVPGTLG
jgi:hypothetical protein